MADFKELLKVDDLKNGQMKAYTTEGREVLVARVGGEFFAADNRCPHFGAKLAEGKLDGTVLTCPKHASQFDLKDGHVVRWTDWSGVKLGIAKVFKSPRPLVVYATKVEGDKVLVRPT
ncbi:MAG: Rieske 2Fe-2S domain-containing protein [Dehalococcoidia bacterium]|nr:Rieske 2Fe-2S domain-containing protein [Dehalococcoidia bacterium]